MKKTCRNSLISFLISAGGVIALSQMLQKEGRGLGYANSFLPVVLLVLVLPVIHRGLWRDRVLSRREKPALSFAAAFCLALSGEVGSRLEGMGYLELADPAMWLALPVLTLFFGVLISCLWHWIEERHAQGTGEPDGRAAANAGSSAVEGAVTSAGAESAAGQPSAARRVDLSKRQERPWMRPLCIFFFFLLIWGIVLLAVWPGFFVYDAQDEFNQVAMRSFTTHHPLLHVLLLGGIICTGNKLFGSYNAGIACYMLFQMLLLAGCFTFLWSGLKRKGAPRLLRAGSVLYFALFPVIQMYVLCSAKDTLYTAAMLLVIWLLVEAPRTEGSVKRLLLALALFSMAAMRHNGFYILILMIPVLFLMSGPQSASSGISVPEKGVRSRAALVGIASLALYLIVTAGLQTVLHAQAEENQEMLTVPIQQLARTYTEKPEVFTQEEEALLFTFLPKEAVAQYRPKLSDGVKIAFQNDAYAADGSRFWKLWLSVGKKAPASYLNAWLLTSYGFWYPEAVIDVYQGNTVFTFTYGDSSYFGFETELPGVRESRIPWLNELFRRMSLELSFQKIPVVSMLFSPGFLFWIYVLGVGALLHRGELRTAAAFLPAFLNWLTVLLGPTFLVRYVLIWWFALPVLLFAVFRRRPGTEGIIV